jgi:hypothetical protein
MTITRFASALAAVGALAFSTLAGAVTIETIGGYDPLTDNADNSTTLQPTNAANELAWICGIINTCAPDATLTKIDFDADEAPDWEAVTGGVAAGWGVQFGGGQAPGYFLIKLGRGGLSDTHYLFTNNANTSWAAISQAFLNGIQVTHRNGSVSSGIPIGRISHISWVTTASVPEPGTLALLGLGLAGIGFARRRKAA